MQLFTRLLLPALGLASMATAMRLNKRQDEALQPWQLSDLYTVQPSGRPNNYPWSTITATISDPNELVVGRDPSGQEVTIPANNTGLNCRAIWIEDDTPYGRRWPCDNTDDRDYGYWFMEVVEVPGGNTLNSFDVKFTFRAYTWGNGGVYSRRFEGSVQMRPRPDGNMAGRCSSGGACGYSLMDELKPLPVNQTEV